LSLHESIGEAVENHEKTKENQDIQIRWDRPHNQAGQCQKIPSNYKNNVNMPYSHSLNFQIR